MALRPGKSRRVFGRGTDCSLCLRPGTPAGVYASFGALFHTGATAFYQVER